jgi:hypothetical protein
MVQLATHSLRCGLHSFAASRLDLDNFVPFLSGHLVCTHTLKRREIDACFVSNCNARAVTPTL